VNSGQGPGLFWVRLNSLLTESSFPGSLLLGNILFCITIGSWLSLVYCGGDRSLGKLSQSLFYLKCLLSWVWCCMPVIPTTGETEAGGSLEPKGSRQDRLLKRKVKMSVTIHQCLCSPSVWGRDNPPFRRLMFFVCAWLPVRRAGITMSCHSPLRSSMLASLPRTQTCSCLATLSPACSQVPFLKDVPWNPVTLLMKSDSS
jgi:hypothetical protein